MLKRDMDKCALEKLLETNITIERIYTPRNILGTNYRVKHHNVEIGVWNTTSMCVEELRGNIDKIYKIHDLGMPGIQVKFAKSTYFNNVAIQITPDGNVVISLVDSAKSTVHIMEHIRYYNIEDMIEYFKCLKILITNLVPILTKIKEGESSDD